MPRVKKSNAKKQLELLLKMKKFDFTISSVALDFLQRVVDQEDGVVMYLVCEKCGEKHKAHVNILGAECGKGHQMTLDAL